jgi:hypothetical protein
MDLSVEQATARARSAWCPSSPSPRRRTSSPTSRSGRCTPKVTEAMIEVERESFRDRTWVVHEEVADGHWAIGSKIIGG